MKTILLAPLALLAVACSASPDAAPPASMQGMQQQSPTGASNIPMGTSNVLNNPR
jgi:hypothetical protein